MKHSDEELPLAPITGWEIKSIPALGALIVRLDYVTNAMQPSDEAHQTPHFVLNPVQARELAQRILARCDQLESGPPPGTGLPKH